MEHLVYDNLCKFPIPYFIFNYLGWFFGRSISKTQQNIIHDLIFLWYVLGKVLLIYTYSTHFNIDVSKRLQKFILQKFLFLVAFCDFPWFSVLFRAIPCYSVLICAFSCFSVIFRAFPLHGDTRKSTRYGLGGDLTIPRASVRWALSNATHPSLLCKAVVLKLKMVLVQRDTFCSHRSHGYKGQN